MSTRLIEECYIVEEDDVLHSEGPALEFIRHMVRWMLKDLNSPSVLRQFYMVEGENNVNI